jgi:hypothetical protein
MMEGKVYRAAWKKERNKFLIRLLSHPKIKVTKKTYEEAETAILDLITLKFGDGEAYLEFTKPLPRTDEEAQYVNPDIVHITENNRAETIFTRLSHFKREYAKELDRYFEKGVCSTCLAPLGKRNSREMIFEYISGNGGIAEYGSYSTCIFSETFIKSVGVNKHPQIRLIPVRTIKKTRTKYFEIAGTIKYRYIGNKKLEHVGWKCPHCSAKRFGYFSPHFSINNFVHVSKTPLGFFLCGSQTEINLCTTRKTWLKKKHFKEIIAMQVGVVNDRSKVEKSPRVKTRRSVAEKPVFKLRKNLKEEILKEVLENKLRAGER